MDVFIAALVTCFVCILTLLAFRFLRLKNRKDILLLGICQAGKTTLFSKLVFNKNADTYTSLKENIGTYNTKNSKSLTIVDIPGHEKIRYEYLSKYRDSMKATLFTIDSKSIQSNVKDTAEYIYNIFTDEYIVKANPRILIVCNKQDNSTAKGAKVVRNLLEKELNILRVTRADALQSLDAKSTNTTTLTRRDADFTFDGSKLRVDFAECSALGNVQPIHDWLAEL